MMDESSEDVAAEFPVPEDPKELDASDNGALRSSGFVLISDSGSEISSLRGPPPPMTTTAGVAAPTTTTSAMGYPVGPPLPPPPPAPASGSSSGGGGSSRELSTSPPSNPYRGHLAHLHHGHAYEAPAVGHGHSHDNIGGHGHSHDDFGGHGHSHGAGPEPPAALPAAFFTPSAPAPDAPLPNLSPPPPPPPGASGPQPAGGYPFPQYQLPQFERTVAPTPPSIDRQAGDYVGLSMGDPPALDYGHGHGHSHDDGHSHDHGHSHGASSTGGGGFFSNLFGSDLMHKVVEKTKSGMETVITTLDPGMKEYIMSGGDVNLVVSASDEMEGLAVRDAFYTVFGKATVRIMPPQVPPTGQLFGAEAARQACLQQMSSLRSSGMVPPDAALLAVASFLNESTPGRWFVAEYLLLQDPTSLGGVDGAAPLECDAYSVSLPVDASTVALLNSGSPGAAQSIDTVMTQQLQQQQHQSFHPGGGPTVSEWRQSRFGLSRRDMIGQAARLLARDYRERTRGRFDVTGPVTPGPIFRS